MLRMAMRMYGQIRRTNQSGWESGVSLASGAVMTPMQPRGRSWRRQYGRTLLAMETRPPGKSKGREVVEAAAAAGAGSVPVVGAAFAVALVTALNWNLNQRRDDWFEGLASKVEELGERVDGFDVETLAGDPLFVDAVVSAARTVEHTHQEAKLTALCNAVLNSVMPGAPDADMQAILLGLIDRLTPSHLRFLTMWNDPAAWFALHGLTPPRAAGAGSRTQTVDAGLPEMRGRQDFYRLIDSDLHSAALMTGNVFGLVNPSSLMDRLTSELGTRLVEFVSTPAALRDLA
jgi:hypothetical protein